MVSEYLDFAERQAEREIPMKIEDCSKHLDGILNSTGENLLIVNGAINHAQAMEKAQMEYKKYKAQTLSGVEKDYLGSMKLLRKRKVEEIEISVIYSLYWHNKLDLFKNQNDYQGIIMPQPQHFCLLKARGDSGKGRNK